MGMEKESQGSRSSNASEAGNGSNGNNGNKDTSPSIFSTLLSNNQVVVSNEWGLLVLHPDILISPTKVADSCSCIRKSVISDRVRSFGDISSPAVLGNLKHAFIEVSGTSGNMTLDIICYSVWDLCFIYHTQMNYCPFQCMCFGHNFHRH